MNATNADIKKNFWVLSIQGWSTDSGRNSAFNVEVNNKMIKEYCDICGKESATNKYHLPIMKDNYVKDKHGNHLIKTKTIGAEDEDVCPNCARKIQFLIDCVLPIVDKDFSMTFESSEIGKSYRIECDINYDN